MGRPSRGGGGSLPPGATPARPGCSLVATASSTASACPTSRGEPSGGGGATPHACCGASSATSASIAAAAVSSDGPAAPVEGGALLPNAVTATSARPTTLATRSPSLANAATPTARTSAPRQRNACSHTASGAPPPPPPPLTDCGRSSVSGMST